MVGTTVSHYKILEKLGEGGMGIVYKAQDLKLDRPVALKFFPPYPSYDPEAKERFIHEAKAASALDDANICVVHDICETDDGQTYIVMAYYEGETLNKKIKGGKLRIEDGIHIAIQIAQGLATAHDHNIVHRDIKPANIMVTSDGVAKIVDFGLVKLVGSTAVTRLGTRLGTVQYMSPEQARGEAVDHRTDIWSLGVVLYEMLTGVRPFPAEYENALVYCILNAEPEPLTAHRSEIPAALEQIVAKCLAKNPDERYQQVDELLADLLSCVKQVSPSGISSRLYLVRRYRVRELVRAVTRFIRGSPWGVATGALLLALIILGTLAGVRTVLEKIVSGSHEGQRVFVLLPFTPVDTSHESLSFCSALTSMLSSRLAQRMNDDGSIYLVSAGDMKNYGVGDVADAAKVCGASLIATGKIQRLGSIFRLSIDLIDPGGGIPRRLNSFIEAYLEDQYRAMEDNAVRFLAGALSLKELQSASSADLSPTEDNEAYQFYAKGRGYLQNYERKANLEFAVGLFLRALGRDPSFAEAYAGLGQAYWRLYEATGDTMWVARADSQMQRALTLKPGLSEAHVTVGMVHNGTGHYEKSVRDFQSALALDQANTDALRGVATAYNNLGRFAEAESTYRRAVALNPGYWAGYNYLGWFYTTRSRYKEAAAQFRKVTELAPDNIRGYTNLAAAYEYMQQWDAASDVLKQAVKVETTAATWSLLGTAYFYQNRFAAASRAFQEGVRLDSSDYTLWGNLASAQYWTSGEREKSIASYRRAAALAEVARRVNPRDPQILSHLASFYAFSGERAKAVPLLEESLREGKDLAERQERAAESYLVLGERTRARECLENALKNGFEPGLIMLNPALSDLLRDPAIGRLIDTSGGNRH